MQTNSKYVESHFLDIAIKMTFSLHLIRPLSTANNLGAKQKADSYTYSICPTL